MCLKLQGLTTHLSEDDSVLLSSICQTISDLSVDQVEDPEHVFDFRYGFQLTGQFEGCLCAVIITRLISFYLPPLCSAQLQCCIACQQIIFGMTKCSKQNQLKCYFHHFKIKKTQVFKIYFFDFRGLRLDWTRLQTYIACRGASAQPSQGGNKATGQLEAFRWVTMSFGPKSKKYGSKISQINAIGTFGKAEVKRPIYILIALYTFSLGKTLGGGKALFTPILILHSGLSHL